MIGEFLDKILGGEENVAVDAKDQVLDQKKINPEKKSIKIDIKTLWQPLSIFLIALLPRLYFLFSHDTQNVGFDWYGDVYHHWQIAYLSKTVGFSQGFLRLWDLKGMEYFWGLLHPLVLAALFTITNSVNIIILRLLSIFCSSVVITLVFLIVKRDFNSPAAWAGALFLTFMPVIFFSDTLGMQEPLSLMLLLFGIYVWPDYPVLTGLSWSIAAMNRAEYWLFSAGLFVAALLDRGKIKAGSKLKLLVSWGVVIIFYMKYLAAWTGNYIYPIYWNFLANVAGLWFKNKLNSDLPHVFFSQTKVIMFAIFITAAVFALLVLIKKYKSYLFYLVGLFNIMLVGFMFSLAGYTWGYIDRFWVDRLFAWPYGFVGVLIAVLVLYYLPTKISTWGKLKLGWITIFLILLASQLLWKPINYYWNYALFAKKSWQNATTESKIIAENWGGKGKILIPDNLPDLTYLLVYKEKVTGQQIISEMFDPFYYQTGKETTQEMDKRYIDWLTKNNISIVFVNIYKLDDTRYAPLFGRYPDHFQYIKNEYDLQLFRFIQ